MLLLCWISKPKHYRYLIYQIREALQTYCLSYFALDMLGSSLVGSGFSKWLRRHFCSSVFTCSFLPTTSSTDFLTSSFSTSKDWWRHFRNSKFVLRHSRYSCHRLRLKEPMHFLNHVIRIILQSALPGLWKFFNGFDMSSGLHQYQMSTSWFGFYCGNVIKLWLVPPFPIYTNIPS